MRVSPERDIPDMLETPLSVEELEGVGEGAGAALLLVVVVGRDIA